MRLPLISLILLLFAATALASSSGRVVYRGQGHSMVDWSELNANDWTDFSLWKKEIYLKDQVPNWRQVLREHKLKESVGRVLQCIGTCLVETGEGSSRASFRTNINELEDFHTDIDSYAWVFLYDGTMVRLSPETSITFKEINVGKKENFFHVRINYGNVLWLSRQKSTFLSDSRRETDSLFLPLDLYEANPKTVIPEVDEDNLFAYLEQSDTKQDRFKTLNKLIKANNEFVKDKPTRSIIVMPNGTILGKNVSMEFVVLVGGKSYFKRRNAKQLGLAEEIKDVEAELLFRGFENFSSASPEVGEWFELSENGRKMTSAGVSMERKFGMGEFVSKRIPTILIARELMMKRYSKFIFSELTRLELARDHGYRQWVQYKNGDRSEIDRRIEYLKEYTRRMETTNILASKKIRGEYIASREQRRGATYSSKFFRRAIDAYLKRGDANTGQVVDYRELNSTSRPLWKRMHAIR